MNPSHAFVACQSQNSTHPMSKVLDIPGLVDVTMLGDAIYIDSQAGYRINGVDDKTVCYWDFVAAPTGAPTNAYTAALFYDIFDKTTGRNGPRGHQYYWSESKKRGIKTYWQPDDHEYWNNLDHSISQAAASWTGGDGQIHTISTKAHVLALWDIANAGHDLVLAQYFDNPPRNAYNGDVPNEMRGFADPSKYKIKYWATDHGANGEIGGNVYRILRMDDVSYKNKQDDTDNANKQYWGPAETKWFLDQCRDAKAKGMVVIVSSPKDYGNNSNSDGPTSYRTVTNAVMQAVHDEDLPVAGWLCGDKHTPHASISRVANGQSFDSLWVVACPFGQNVGAMATFAQQVHVNTKPDECVIGVVTVDAANREVGIGFVDAYTLDTRVMYWVPFGARVPSRMTSNGQPTYYSPPANLKFNPTMPASDAAYTNTTRKNQMVLLVGGASVTDVKYSVDGTNYESIGVQRHFMLAPNHSFKVTYSSTAPTLSVYYQESLPG